MIELDDRLRALRDEAADWATGFSAAALELERDPTAIHRHLDLPAVSYLATMTIPPEYGNPGSEVAGHRFYGDSALERVIVLEELARGDAGTMLASPGPSMSGVLVDVMADEQQKCWFYGRLRDRPIWTFFALTEPDRGSDATAIETSLTPAPGERDVLLLNGTKRYVGNAARGQLGVVFARSGPGPLGISVVLVETSAAGYHAEPIATVGLRGLQLSAITLESVEIRPDRVLGRHLSPTRRGMWSCIQAFNQLRPGVAAIALGIARAAYDYVTAERTRLSGTERHRLDELGRRISGVRELVRLAAATVDARPGEGHLASAAKARASELAEDVTLAACDFLGPGGRLEHPLLDKLVRDARGVEFMEGTRNIQKLGVFQSVVTGKLRRDDPFRPVAAAG